MSTTQKVFLVTGGNSGLGYQCCLQLAKQDNTRVILAGRNAQRVDDAVAAIQPEATATSTVESGIVDLGSLKSVRQFADDLIKRDIKLFALVCNAGVQLTKLTYTEDGFESSIGVNHIGHFLLVKLLQERASRIVVMSSETHDPRDVAGIPNMTTDNLEDMARGRGGPYITMEAYSNSKLCNLVFVKEFVRRFPNGPEILAYTPGFTPDTKLFRERPNLLKEVGNVDRTSTAEYSGNFLARIASEESWDKNGWSNGEYIRIDGIGSPSDQACDPELGSDLWVKSEDWIKDFSP